MLVRVGALLYTLTYIQAYIFGQQLFCKTNNALMCHCNSQTMLKSGDNTTHQDLVVHMIHSLTMKTTGLLDIGLTCLSNIPQCKKETFSFRKCFNHLVEELKGDKI